MQLEQRYDLAFMSTAAGVLDDTAGDLQETQTNRGDCQVHDQASEPSAGQAAVVGRAFFPWTER
jgi:hypothetical protein